MSGAVAAASVGGLPAIGISAPWGDIVAAGAGANSNVTLTYSGGARQVRLRHDITGLLVERRINSGSYVAVPSGVNTDVSVSSGDTLNFQATIDGGADSGNMTVTDLSRNAVLDVFTITIS